MKISDVLLRPFGPRDPNCPNEADILAYSENKLSQRGRAQIERHIADCDDCRRVVAFLARESDETPAPLSEEAAAEQTNRVLVYIQNDERNRRQAESKVRAAAGFHISFPQLVSVGLIICAIAFAAFFLLTRGRSPADAAMESLRSAVKETRHTEARISGGFDYSRYIGVTRGGDRSDDDPRFSSALNKVKTAKQENAPVNESLVLARVYLARASTREDAKQALAILNALAARGVETPEALNDTGVAHLQMENYDDAIAYFSKALAKSPRYDEALFNKALAEQRAHRDDDAKRDWLQFINKSSEEDWKAEARAHLIALGGPATNR